LPYAVGVAGIVVMGGLALRWSRRRPVGDASAASTHRVSPELEDKLDDELRDLD
jgi:hypothetical protein